MKLMLDSETEERQEEKKGQEPGGEDGPKPLQPWAMVLIFVGIAAAAALICAVIWYFTHGGREEGGDSSGQFAAEATPSPGESGDEVEEESGSSSHIQEDASEKDSEFRADSESDSNLDSEEPGEAFQGSQGEGESQSSQNSSEASGEQPESGAAGEGGSGHGQSDPASGNAAQENPEDKGSAPDSSSDDSDGASQVASSGNASQENDTQGNASSGQSSQGSMGQAGMAMEFEPAEDSVTPKEVVNLRSAPTTQDPANIVTQVRNGEVLSRTGINQDAGWSKLEYQGQTLYAVTSNLTTDLSYTPPVQAQDPNQFTTAEGRVVIFQNCDNWVTAKEYANLRTEPSTSQGEASVVCQLKIGDRAHRTGYSEDTGWSRVEYNGQVLYVVSSLVIEVNMETE